MTEYLNWGCEFISEPSHREPIAYLGDSIWLPVELLDLAVNNNNLSLLSEEKIRSHQISIAENRIINPGILIVAPNGSFLYDGNHRFQAAKRLNMKRFPVEIKLQEARIQVRGLPHEKLIAEMANLINLRRYQ